MPLSGKPWVGSCAKPERWLVERGACCSHELMHERGNELIQVETLILSKRCRRRWWRMPVEAEALDILLNLGLTGEHIRLPNGDFVAEPALLNAELSAELSGQIAGKPRRHWLPGNAMIFKPSETTPLSAETG